MNNSSTDAPRSPPPRRSRSLTIEVMLEISGHVPLADGYLVTALADALPEIDQQGLLMPGIEWPRPGERLLDWSVRLVASGGTIGGGSPVERLMEERRREDGPLPRRRRMDQRDIPWVQEAESLIAEIDDLERQLLQQAEAAWTGTSALRHAAAALEVRDDGNLRDDVAAARKIVSAARAQLLEATPAGAGSTEEG